MKSKLICYSLKGSTPVERMKFQREMYGHKDFSNKGAYIYQRKGILDLVKNKKILDCVIVTDNQGSKTILKVLKKHGAKTYVFDVSVPFNL